jgi:glucokinase
VSKTYTLACAKTLNAEQIANLAIAGDADAIEAYNLAGQSIAKGLAHTLKVIDVGHVVVGGGMSQAWPLMKSAFEGQLNADLIPVLRDRVKISVSKTQDQAGMIGAALLSIAK